MAMGGGATSPPYPPGDYFQQSRRGRSPYPGETVNHADNTGPRAGSPPIGGPRAPSPPLGDYRHVVAQQAAQQQVSAQAAQASASAQAAAARQQVMSAHGRSRGYESPHMPSGLLPSGMMHSGPGSGWESRTAPS